MSVRKTRLAKQELERRHTLERYRYYRIPKYFEGASETDAHTILLPCPNKVGKSTFCVFESYWTATDKHKFKKYDVPNESWLVGPTLAHVKEVLIAGFHEWGLTKFWRQYYKKDGIIEWNNGSLTYIKSYDKRENLQGRTIKKIIMDEEAAQDIWYELSMRFKAGQKLEIFVAATPLNCEEWFADLCDRAENGEKGLYVSPSISIHDALKKNGGHLSQEDIDRVEQLCIDDTERRIRLHGERVRRGGQFLPLVERIHRIGAHKLPGGSINPKWLKIIGIDPHPRKPTSVVWITFDNDNDAYAYDHLKVSGTCKQQVEQIKAHNGDQKIFAIYMDPAAKTAMSSNLAQVDWNYFDEFALLWPEVPVIQSVKSPDFVTDAVRYRLAYNHDKPLGPNNRPHLYILDYLHDLWQSLKSVRWQEFKDRSLLGAKEQMKKGKEDDLMALGYGLVKHPLYVDFPRDDEKPEKDLPVEDTIKEMGY